MTGPFQLIYTKTALALALATNPSNVSVIIIMSVQDTSSPSLQSVLSHNGFRVFYRFVLVCPHFSKSLTEIGKLLGFKSGP